MGDDVNPFSVFEEFALPAKASSHNPPKSEKRKEKASSILREGARERVTEEAKERRDEEAFERAFARRFIHRVQKGQPVPRMVDIWNEWYERCEKESQDGATRERRLDRDLDDLMKTHAPEVHAVMTEIRAARGSPEDELIVEIKVNRGSSDDEQIVRRLIDRLVQDDDEMFSGQDLVDALREEGLQENDDLSNKRMNPILNAVNALAGEPNDGIWYGWRIGPKPAPRQEEEPDEEEPDEYVEDPKALRRSIEVVRKSPILMDGVDWRLEQHMERHPRANKHEAYEECLKEEARQFLSSTGHPRYPAPPTMAADIRKSAKVQTDKWKARVLKKTGKEAWIGPDGTRRSEEPGAGLQKIRAYGPQSTREAAWMKEAFTIPFPGKKTEYKRYTPFPGEVELGRRYAELDRRGR